MQDMLNLARTDLPRLCRQGLGALLRAGIDFVYPPHCVLCGRATAESKLCAACRAELWPTHPHACHRCGAPVGPYLDPTGGCNRCRAERFAFDTVVRLGVYEGELRRACLRAKQPGGEPVVAALGELLWEYQCERLQQERFDLVVSVPQHWWRRIVTRHHAATTLAQRLAARMRVRCDPKIIVKIRHTPRQTQLTATERRRNLRGAFRVATGVDLTGACVLLVDDILTTGSTAHEVSRALRRAGAERITVAVIARGIGQT